MKKIFSLSLLPLLLFIVNSCGVVKDTKSVATQKSSGENSLLWEISGNELTKPSYLFGTIHMICENDFFLNESMKTSFDKAEQLILEVDMDDMQMMMDATMSLMLPADQSLKDFFSEEDYKKVSAYVKENSGMDIKMVEGMKPFMLMSMMAEQNASCEATKSYEQEFVKMAKKKSIEIKGVETFKQQLAIFEEALPDSFIVKTILNGINNPDEGDDQFAEMISHYKKQNLNALANLINSDEQYAENADVLINNRNRNWIPILEKEMAATSSFIAVGAGHLAGKEGVIELLRKQGYSVKPVH